jgi:G3E family GTPase
LVLLLSSGAARPVADKEAPFMKERLPVTVVSGFLGAGKTAVVSGLLGGGHGQRLGAVVNDLAAVNVDANHLQAQLGAGAREAQWLAEATGGCICCTLRDDFSAEAARLAGSGRFDGLIVEAAGTAVPRVMAEAFATGELAELTRLDTLLTVVDAGTFLNQCPVADAGEDNSTGIKQAQAELLTAQAAFATALVINKIDLVTPTELEALEAMLSYLNPTATIVRAQHGRPLPLSSERNGGWDRSRAALLARPAAARRFQIGSFVYTSKRPFHPQRLWRLLQRKPWFGALRSKGFVWLASRPNVAALWSQVGPFFQLESAGLWWGTESSEAGTDALAPATASPAGAPVFGECRQEIAFFGHALDGAVLSAALDECLLTDRELSGGPMSWCFLPDPLPASFRVADVAS